MFEFKEKQIPASTVRVGDAVKDASDGYYHIVKSVEPQGDVVALTVSMGFRSEVKATSLLTVLDHD